MSVRVPEEDNHTHIKGTMISMLWRRPSKLHVSIVQTFGLPNADNKIVTETHIVHVAYDRSNDQLVHAWAEPRPGSPPPSEAWRRDGCAVS